MGSMAIVDPRSTSRRLKRFLIKPAARYPADPRAVFILALSVFSGLTALALGAAPNTLNELLPAWGIFVWGGVLTVGSAVTLTGMFFQNLNGILAEQIGSVMVGVATLFYSTLAFYVVGISAIQVVGIIMAWGLACLVRWGQLQALIQDGIEKAEANHVEAVIQERIHQAVEDDRG
jgi:hypothetical protein